MQVSVAGLRTSSILKKWGRQEGAALPLAEPVEAEGHCARQGIEAEEEALTSILYLWHASRSQRVRTLNSRLSLSLEMSEKGLLHAYPLLQKPSFY